MEYEVFPRAKDDVLYVRVQYAYIVYTAVSRYTEILFHV